MLRFEIVNTLEEAEHYWKKFSPQKTICDSWEYRYNFYKYLKFEIVFFVGFENDIPIGVLPLQRNNQNKSLEFFGGSYMEDNTVFVQSGYEFAIQDFYKQIQEQCTLEYISAEDAYTKTLSLLDYKYILPLAGLHTFEEYLAQYLDGEARGKMRRKLRKLEHNSIEIRKNEFEHIEKLFFYNENAFGKDSTFHLPFRKESFRDILTLPFSIHLLTFYINGELKAVSLSVLYNGVYEYLNLGADLEFRELRSYVHMKNIEEALQLGADTLNAFSADCGWKELFHFQKIPQYKFDKNP